MITIAAFWLPPRSASQTSPGLGFIEQIENVLPNTPGPTEVERV